MISMRLSFSEFLERVKDEDWLPLIEIAERECRFADTLAKRGRYSKTGRDPSSRQGQRRETAAQYARLLAGLLFWMNSGHRPGTFSDGDLLAIRPLCERLIEKNQLKAECIDIFRL